MSINYEEFLERAYCREWGLDYESRVAARERAIFSRCIVVLMCAACFVLGMMVQ